MYDVSQGGEVPRSPFHQSCRFSGSMCRYASRRKNHDGNSKNFDAKVTGTHQNKISTQSAATVKAIRPDHDLFFLRVQKHTHA